MFHLLPVYDSIGDYTGLQTCREFDKKPRKRAQTFFPYQAINIIIIKNYERVHTGQCGCIPAQSGAKITSCDQVSAEQE